MVSAKDFFATGFVLAVPLVLALVTRVTAGLDGQDQSAAAESILFDFTREDASIDDWRESSDTVRDVGESKASLQLVKRKTARSAAVFFGLLRPQPNGACFAGMNTVLAPGTLEGASALRLRVRGDGKDQMLKVVLKENGQRSGESFEKKFLVPAADPSAATPAAVVDLPLDEFIRYFRGKEVSGDPLAKERVASLGLQVFGGVYDPSVSQRGAFALEVETISAVA